MRVCAGLNAQLAQERQQAAARVESLAVAQQDLDQLSMTYQSLQQQLQVKVLDLQQTQDSLEERVRQHRQVQIESGSQLTQLRTELHSSTEAHYSVQQELAQRVDDISGADSSSSIAVECFTCTACCLVLCFACFMQCQVNLNADRWASSLLLQ